MVKIRPIQNIFSPIVYIVFTEKNTLAPTVINFYLVCWETICKLDIFNFEKGAGDPVALLRGAAGETSLSRYWAYAATPNPSELADDHVGAYSDLMSASQPLVAGEILDAFDFTRHRCLLDVGGGQGTFLMTVAARHPALHRLDLLLDKGVDEFGQIDGVTELGGSGAFELRIDTLG